MLVRPFQLSDYAFVNRLLSEALSEECYTETIEAFARQLSWDSELVLVAESNSQIVGTIIGTIDNNQGYYYRIAVRSDSRRKGVGRSLITALKTRFNNRKVSKTLIPIDTHNEYVVPLFQSLGFDSADFTHKMQDLKIVNGKLA